MPRILVVDDHPVVREGLGGMLMAAVPGVELGTAERAAEAVEHMRAGSWDLVLLDLSLPDEEGTALLRRLRRAYPSVPVMVVSMYPASQFAQRVLQAGAVAYISKDRPPHELVRAVHAALAGERALGPGMPEGQAHPPDEPARLPHSALSDREYQVFRLIGQGRTVSEIAADLSLSVKTISTYRTRILEKMEMHNSAELMHYAIAHRLVPRPPA